MSVSIESKDWRAPLTEARLPPQGTSGAFPWRMLPLCRAPAVRQGCILEYNGSARFSCDQSALHLSKIARPRAWVHLAALVGYQLCLTVGRKRPAHPRVT